MTDTDAASTQRELALTTSEVEVQRRLAVDLQTDVRAALAKNPDLAPEVQRILAEDFDVYVRSRLASNACLELALQLKLLDNRSWQTRIQLANNPNLADEVQRRLATSPDGAVRAAIGFHPKLLADLGLVLAGDPGSAVRYAVMTNPGVALTHQFPVAFLLDGERGQEYLERELTGTDPAAREALVSSWSGTLGELLATLESFS